MRLGRRLWPLAASMALLAFLFAVVLPTRTFLAQREEIAAEEAKLEILSRENRKLAARVRQLHTDAEIERIAREQYNLVRPGEEAYAILPGPADAAAALPPAEPPVPRDSRWWERAWASLAFWE